uniref:Reverse transcriptase domain-containing protein n=1 Tax=Poecilia formosa TaxID=48698 RepID=A0A087X618_POEFO
INNCDPWTIKGLPVPMLSPHQTVRYLGVDLCPTKGIVPTNLQVRLQDIIDHVNAAPLKPTQKLTLFSTYGIPWVLYPSVMSMVGSVDLGAADRLIRKEVKSWLHLKPCTTDGILYSRKKDGGLGLQKLGKVVPIAQLRRWSKLLQSKDPSCKTLAGTFLPKGDLDSRWRVAFGTDKKVKLKQKLESLEPHSIGPNWRREEFQKWISLRSQGRGLNAFRNDPISNSWLKDPGWLSESDFIVALHLRSNTVNTLTTLGRGSQTNSSCRLCHKGWEGLPHILQKIRMMNHNIICNRLALEARKLDWMVFQEKHISSTEFGTAVPDLILIKEKTGIAIDVAIAFELRSGTLRRRARRKTEKYYVFAPVIAETFDLLQVHTYGFPLGARGKWYEDNMEVLLMMGLSKIKARKLARSLSTKALQRYSLHV